MTHREGSPAVKIGVLLAGQPDDLGEWLADGAAFEAAGADALWIDPGAEPAFDPLALTAALAAVTFRSLLVTALPASAGPSRAVARTLATIGRLSRDRLRVLGDAVPPADRAETGPVVFRRSGGNPETFEDPTGPAGTGRWVSVPAPDSRAAWRAALLDTGALGCRGLLVPAHPRLLDILRNPDDPDQRRDLQLAVG